MLRATALDAERRGHARHSCSASAGDAAVVAASTSGEGEKGGGGAAERVAGDAGNRDANGRRTNAGFVAPGAEEDEAQADTWTQLGALDISKVS